MNLYIDDIRNPDTSKDWIIVRSSSEAINFINKNGIPNFISFDHDLGGEDTARIVVNHLIEEVLNKNLAFPPGFTFKVHSANPVGAEWIHGTMCNFLSYLKLL